MLYGAIQPGLDIIAPALLGLDPTNVEEIYYVMDETLISHLYIKSTIDIACWDILGKALDKPIYELMGGKQTEKPIIIGFLHRDFRVFDAKIRQELELFRNAGCKRYQTKASKGAAYAFEYIDYIRDLLLPGESLWLDANRAWTVGQAIQVADYARQRGVGLWLEQPCETYEMCRDVMRIGAVPVIMDECIIDINQLARAAYEGIGALSIKIDWMGGLTKSKLLRDFCVAAGIPVDIQSINGVNIADSYVAHLATSTPPHILGYVYAGQTVSDTRIADDGAQVTADWHLIPPDEPGLGVTPDEQRLELLQTWN
jgi:L-alanine-DL-glutamate epimerase-like enolase superfamily enzyme